MQLKYIGPDPEGIGFGALPLPEGWGAFDHEEADAAVAAAKLASGLYERVKPEKPAKPGEGE